MNRATLVALATLVPSLAAVAQKPSPTLLEARAKHETTLTRRDRQPEPLPEPDSPLFARVTYPSPVGDLAAWVSKPTRKGKSPAILWITGGFPPGGIDASAWHPSPRENDQSAKAYRLAGVVTMYPTTRGTFGNPGVQEGFYGEVDDVLAAYAYLAARDDVDPKRIFLGGHSTGGTLALLVAATGHPFAGVIAFGPVDDPIGYGAARMPFDPNDANEVRLRAPIRHLAAIRCPTIVIEGENGNHGSLEALKRASKNERLRFVTLPGADHFEILAPINDVLAKRIAQGPGAEALDAPVDALRAAVARDRRARREARDLQTLAHIRASGLPLDRTTVFHVVLARERAPLEKVDKAVALPFFNRRIVARTDDDGARYHEWILHGAVALNDLQAVFDLSASVERATAGLDVHYDGWTVFAPEGWNRASGR